MKLYVAGNDRSMDLAPGISRVAAERAAVKDAPRFLPPHMTALLLGTAESTSDYLDKLIQLMWIRTGISTLPFWIPHKPGLVGRIMRFIKLRLWLLLRYQHDRIAFQQEATNCELASALEFMREEHRKETADLRARIEQLEKRSGSRG